MKSLQPFILIIITILLTSGCINDKYMENWEEIDIFYKVFIDSNSKNNFTIILPIPLIKGEEFYENPIKLMQELDISNSIGEYNVQKNIYGIGLEIKANDSLDIHANKNFKDKPNDLTGNYSFFDLSMKTDDSWYSNYWIFFSGDNGSISLSMQIYYHYENIGGGTKFDWIIEEHSLINGWHEIDLNITRIEFDK